MKIAYCFMERQDAALEEFIRTYDAALEIHIFSPISASCENKLFYCLGEVTNLFAGTEEKTWFVTDVPELYTHICKAYRSYFDRVEFLDQGVEEIFDKGTDYEALLDFEMEQVLDMVGKRTLSKLAVLNRNMDIFELYDAADRLQNVIHEERWKEKAFWVHALELLLCFVAGSQTADFYFLFLYSVLMKLVFRAEYTNRFLRLALKSDSITGEHLYFIWNQFKNISLKKAAAMDEETRLLLDEIYEKSYAYYKRRIKDRLRQIPDQERMKNRILVMTIQFLGEGHAPTRTVMERCKTLRKMGMEVCVVNTAEQYTAKGVIPFYKVTGGAVRDDYDALQEIQMGTERFPFKQLSRKQKLENRLDTLLERIGEYRPYYILSIGTGSMLADLCGNIVPCASMALMFSSLPHTMNRMKILGRKQKDSECAADAKDILIESRFTFELNAQRTVFTRKHFGLPEDAFLLAVIGIRLDYELDDAFLQMLCDVVQKGCHVVFAGVLNTYDTLCQRYAAMGEHATFIGYCEDILAFMDICDLYVNPARLGGGFSVIEAFYKGVPGVYLSMGDVAAAGGEEFAVKDYNEMEEIILQYRGNPAFYKEMSRKAEKRAEYMTDSVSAMKALDYRIRSVIENGGWKGQNGKRV